TDPLASTDPVRDGGSGPGSADAQPSLEAVSEFAADEVAAELRCSRAAAQSRVALAVLLQRLPATRRALAAGRIDLVKARAIADATLVLTDTDAQAVEARVLPRAGEQTAPRLREALRRAVLRTDPAAAKARHDPAVAQRGVALRALPAPLAH